MVDIKIFQQKPRAVTKAGPSFGTPYKIDETPLGENLERGEVPTSLRKTFRHHPEIAALSFLPDPATYTRLNNDIAEHGIRTPIILWRTQRNTTDGRTITEYFIVDGYLRMNIAEDLGLAIEDIPWIVDEDIQSLEEALNTASKLKLNRAHYNDCERKYMIGIRYLQEKKRAGAPVGSLNNPSGLPKMIKNTNFANEDDKNEPNGDNLSPLGSDSVDLDAAKTSVLVAKDLGINERSVYRYANAAEQIEIAVAAIQRKWGISRTRAIRCCTQIHLVKYAGEEVLDARLVTAGDWGRLDLKPDCMDPFPTILPSQRYMTQKDKLHYHDEREQAVIAAVRELVTPPRMRPNVIDAEILPQNDDPEIPEEDARNPIARAVFEVMRQTRSPLHYKMFVKMNTMTQEELDKDPEYVDWAKQKKLEAIQKARNTALTSPEQDERIAALRFLAMLNEPLPTDELDPRVEAILRPKFKEEPQNTDIFSAADLKEKFPVEPDWESLFEASQDWDQALRRYRDALLALEDMSNKLLSELRVIDDKFARGAVKTLSSWQTPAAKRMRETFLEMAKILADTTSNQQTVVVNRDSTIHQRIKATIMESWDRFSGPCCDIAREIQVSTRLVSHKNHQPESLVREPSE